MTRTRLSETIAIDSLNALRPLNVLIKRPQPIDLRKFFIHTEPRGGLDNDQMEADKRGPDGCRIEELCQGEVTSRASSHQRLSPAVPLSCTTAACNRCPLITHYGFIACLFCVGHPEAGQGGPHLGRVLRAGPLSEEPVDVSEGRNPAAEHGDTRAPLGAAGWRDAGGVATKVLEVYKTPLMAQTCVVFVIKQISFTVTDHTTLEDLLALKLHLLEDEVRSIVDKAVKEMAIEKVLNVSSNIFPKIGIKVLNC